MNEGIAAGEVTGGIEEEVRKKIDEIFREREEPDALEKALEKIAELQAKVSEALEKGEITYSARAQSINEALDELAAALEPDT